MARDTAEAPVLPPLLSGREIAPEADALAAGVEAARAGTDAGLLLWAARPDRLSAAVVLAPEVALRQAAPVLIAGALAAADAIGVNAPPEVEVHFDWPAVLRVNGGRVGALEAAASADDPDAVPDWLVLAIGVDVLDPGLGPDPGLQPDRTCLAHEGCGDITPRLLLESWSRHFLVWLNEMETGGMDQLLRGLRNRLWAREEERSVTLPDGATRSGRIRGLDEWGGLILETAEGITLLPLHAMLQPREKAA